MLSKVSRVRLTLPAPTGPCPPGTVALHLTDYSRRNPWAGVPALPRAHDQHLVSGR